jgi:ATP-dependent DNA helicase DinG
MTWKEIAEPTLNALGYVSRAQQEVMGDAICNAIQGNTNLIVEAPTGTGKSLALLIPIIDTIVKREGQYRALISTATKTLQDQYIGDLKRLKNPGFSYTSLKGRDNYLCYNRAKEAAKKSMDIRQDFELISLVAHKIKTGERSEIENLLHQHISNETWRAISGNARECSDMHCTEAECYGAKALSIAKKSNIIVTNNAILRVDAERRFFDESGYVGPIDLVAVDEAHELESSLISGWTISFNDWEFAQAFRKITRGIDVAIRLNCASSNADDVWQENIDSFNLWLENYKQFHKEFYGNSYLNTDNLLKINYVSSDANMSLQKALIAFEDSSSIVKETNETLSILSGQFEETLKIMKEDGIVGKKTVNKAITACKDLTELLTTIQMSLESSDGIVFDNGVPKSTLAHVYLNKRQELKVRFDSIPIDISSKAQNIWSGRTSILMSATLRDLYTRDFSYVKTALSFNAQKELVLDSVFDLKHNQLVYTTPGVNALIGTGGAQFSLEELLSLIQAAQGRTLVLFTAKSELLSVKEYLDKNPLEYPMFFQTNESDKQFITQSFRENNNSVLFATKSFFQGVDFKGETLSQVILVKFPLLQYNDLCKNQEIWWKKRGFPRWYDSKSMEIFQQAVGRVLRQEDDKGVISIIDQRVLNNRSRVSHLTRTLVQNMGSPVTQDISDVKGFLL